MSDLGRTDVVVTGVGLVSCLGSLPQTWSSLLAGKSGIKQHQPFPELPPYPLGLIFQTPSELNTLTQLLVAAVCKDGQMSAQEPECGVVIGSSRGAQAAWEKLARPKNSVAAIDWLSTLPDRGAIATAESIGSQAPVLAPMAACATGIWALFRGFELIQTGRCQRVLAGAVEAPITPLTLTGFERMGALAKTGAYPFDRRREGLVLGEGGAIFVLESAELARSRGVPIYGQIKGFGLTCDAYHVSAPVMSGQSAIAAIKYCLDRSGLSPTEIDYIHAHGTGTKLNDQREAQIIRSLLPKVPVSSTKGATGHTLGASGAIGAAFCLMALKTGQLPPCVGLQESAFDLDLVTTARQSSVEQVLCFSFGFGGQNAAMALGKYS